MIVRCIRDTKAETHCGAMIGKAITFPSLSTALEAFEKDAEIQPCDVCITLGASQASVRQRTRLDASDPTTIQDERP